MHNAIIEHLIFTYVDFVTSMCKSKFFVRFGNGKPIVNLTKQLDSLQQEFNLSFLCSSNARRVVTTLKRTAGLDALSSAVIVFVLTKY